MIPYFHFTQIQVGGITLQIWGLMASFGFLSTLFLSIKEAKRKGIDENSVWDAVILAVVAMIVGSRTFYVLLNRNEFSDMKEIFDPRSGGFSSLGGMAVVLGAVYVFGRLRKINIWKLADTLTPGAIVGIAMVRAGCFLVYDHVGKITSLPWGRLYVDQTIRHPVSLYHLISAIIIFFIIWHLREKHSRDGVLFLTFIVYYSISRFLLDFIYCYDLAVCNDRYGGLTITQWILLAFIPILCYYYIRRCRIQFLNWKNENNC